MQLGQTETFSLAMGGCSGVTYSVHKKPKFLKVDSRFNAVAHPTKYKYFGDHTVEVKIHGHHTFKFTIIVDCDLKCWKKHGSPGVMHVKK
jgi:hypothetical protein